MEQLKDIANTSNLEQKIEELTVQIKELNQRLRDLSFNVVPKQFFDPYCSSVTSVWGEPEINGDVATIRKISDTVTTDYN